MSERDDRLLNEKLEQLEAANAEVGAAEGGAGRREVQRW